VRLLIIQDISGSMRRNRTPRLAPEDLALAVDIVREHGGGEIGFGLIGERSDLPLLRFTIEPPPPPPPPPPANPLFRSRWEQERRRLDALRQQWARDVEARGKAFLAEVENRLRIPPAPVTDVCSALKRGDLMLAEPGAAEARAFFLVITDGVHNVRDSRCPETLAARATLLLVNGVGLLGALRPYQPLRFESVRAALRFIQDTLAREEKR
jgi:hypothetical protein